MEAAELLTKPMIQFAERNMDKHYYLSGGYKPTTKRFADLDGPDFYPCAPAQTYTRACKPERLGVIP